MSSMLTRLPWFPAAMVGAGAAAAAEMGVGLLLYSRGGILGALTLLLCVEAVALGCGLWAAPRDAAPPWTGVRRAWFVLLLSLILAAVVAASWEGLGGLSSTWPRRGLGLAFLAAFPLYAAGAVLGAPSLGDHESTSSAGPAAAVGAAFGFVLLGAGRGALRLAPVAYVSAVVLVSAGALVHTAILEERGQRWRDWAERGTARDDAGARPPLPDRRSRPAAPPPPGSGP